MNLQRAHTQAVHAIVEEAVASMAAQPSTDGVQATVVSLDVNNNATVQWNGLTFGVRRIADYIPSVGDQVLLLLVGSSPVMLGQVV